MSEPKVSHEWLHEGDSYRVRRYGVEALGPGGRWENTGNRPAVARELARLAAEVKRLKQIETLNCMSIEEGCEIINEMSAALAAMVDEDLTECSASHCLGHFGEKTSEAFNVALESRRADRARIARLEERLDDYQAIFPTPGDARRAALEGGADG